MRINELKEKIDNFDIDDFLEYQDEYESGIKRLIKDKDYDYAFKAVKAFSQAFAGYSDEVMTSYRPGRHYRYSYLCLIKYAEFCEKGILGITPINKKEADIAYLQLLKHADTLEEKQIKKIIPHINVILKHAYSDLNDRYACSLNALGRYCYDAKKYKEAFKCFKKAADFDIDGRQIIFPYYMLGQNQTYAGTMYAEGKGTKKDIEKARYYYRLAADNFGRKYHPRLAEYYMEKKEYATAFLCLTEYNRKYPYDLFFISPDNEYELLPKIFAGLKETASDDYEKAILGMMYIMGMGTDKNEEVGRSLITSYYKDFTEDWMFNYLNPF